MTDGRLDVIECMSILYSVVLSGSPKIQLVHTTEHWKGARLCQFPICAWLVSPGVHFKYLVFIQILENELLIQWARRPEGSLRENRLGLSVGSGYVPCSSQPLFTPSLPSCSYNYKNRTDITAEEGR